MAHPIVHVEFSANQPAEASKFYSELFGWTAHYDANVDYHMFDVGNNMGGGFPAVSDTTRAGSTLVYVGTDDLDATLAKVKELGGTVLNPYIEVPNMGAMAIFSDPTGNVVGLWKAFAPPQ